MDIKKLVVDSLAGAVPGELFIPVKDMVKKNLEYKGAYERLQNTFKGMNSVLDVLQKEGEFSQNSRNMLSEVSEELQKGNELLQNGPEVNSLSIFKRFTYGKDISALESRIAYFTQSQGWAHLCSEIHQLRLDVKKIETIENKINGIRQTFIEGPQSQASAFMHSEVHDLRVNVEKIEHIMEDGFETLKQEIKEIHQMFIQSISEIDKLASDLSAPESNVLEFPGLETSIRELKEYLLRKDVPVLGVVGMGGSGKTTLATAICNDNEVKDSLHGMGLIKGNH